MRRRPTEDAARREVAGVHQKLQEFEGGQFGLEAELGSSESTEIGGRLSCLLWSQRPVPGFGSGKKRRVSRSHDRMGLRNQPSGPRIEVTRSILVHCTSSHPPFTIFCLPPAARCTSSSSVPVSTVCISYKKRFLALVG